MIFVILLLILIMNIIIIYYGLNCNLNTIMIYRTIVIQYNSLFSGSAILKRHEGTLSLVSI